MHHYEYVGPVMEFGRCVASQWTAYTIAQSPEKARSNLAYRFKKENNRVAYAKITLPGRIVEIV